MIENITVILLAGGKSKRFWPFTDKTNFDFGGKSFLERQIDFLQKCGFKKIICILQKNYSWITEYPNIIFIIQKGEGQKGAILSASDYLKNDQLLILNADDVIVKSLFDSLIYIIKPDINILTGFKVKNYFPGGYLKLAGKKVTGIIEKPDQENLPSNFVRIVCDYYCNGNSLLKALKNIKCNLYEDAINIMIDQNNQFEMLEYEDIWLPMKFSWHALDIMNFYLGQISQNEIDETAEVDKTAILSGKVILGKNVKVMEYVKLVGPLYIGDNTIICNHTMVRSSMIGSNCIIGFNSDIARSYIGKNVWLHSNYIGDSIIGNDVSLGAGTILANLKFTETNISSIIDGKKIDTQKNKLGALIGDNVRIGVSSQIMPGVKIGQNSIVGPGVILSEDLADNKKCYFKQKIIYLENSSDLKLDRQKFRSQI